MQYLTPDELKEMATKYGWDLLDHQGDIAMISFKKYINGYRARINVYYTRMTVATVINHPLKGINQLFRRRVGPGLMERIFENPRVHTHSTWAAHGYRYR